MPWRRYSYASGRATVADVEGAAGRLLLALNVNQAHDREGAVVEPGEQGDPGRRAEAGFLTLPRGCVVAVGPGGIGPRPGAQRASQEHSRRPAPRLRVQDHPTRPGHAAWVVTDGAGESRQERGPALVICGTMLIVSLYLEQEVRNDEEEGRQLAASLGVVARPGFVARADDRRLLTGAASLVRILLRHKAILGSEQIQLPGTPLFYDHR